MFDNIRGVIRFRANGIKLYSFINAIRESRIICTAQECKNDEYYGEIYSSSLKELQELAKKYNIELHIEDRKGAIFKVKRYKYRFGIIIGALVAIMFIVYISNVAITIEVTGNNKISEEQIISTLNDIGISKGTFIPNINFALCEKKLKISIDELAWVGIRRSGNRIVVDVDEMVEQPEMIKSNLPSNIISTKNAQIKSVKVYNGSLNYIVGDGVRVGDVLISGIYTDSKGNILTVNAIGEIIGEYEEKMIFEQAYEEEKRISEGEISRKSLDFFTFKIPLNIGKIDLDEYDYNEDICYFMIAGKRLPIGIIHSTYTPYTKNIITYTTEEAEELIHKKITMHEENFYSNVKIINKEINKINEEGKIKYEVIYTLEGEIGKKSEILMKK
ncbi:MAG: sporulation protein YqfD [Clostridiales bacterium]|nr:sporulation protein YqfD [Clostridiales bacterium]